MLIIDSFGKNIICGGDIIGYIDDNAIYVNRRKYLDISDEGIISKDGVELGFVDDDGSIIVNNKEVGYIDDKNNFVFYKLSVK